MRQQLKQHSRPFTTADVDVTTATKGQQMPKSPQQRMAKPTSNPSQQRRMNPKPKPPQQRRAKPTPKQSQQEPHPDVIRVSSTTDPEKLASAMNYQQKEGKTAFKVTAIGAGAINQASKALARLADMLKPWGLIPMMTISFFCTRIDGQERTGIRWLVMLIPMKK